MKKKKEENIYEHHGFKDREEYFQDLADSNGVDPTIVDMFAEVLGQDEDFDGLVSSLEDFSAAPLIW